MDPAAKPSGVPFSQAKEDETGMFQETNCVVGISNKSITISINYIRLWRFFKRGEMSGEMKQSISLDKIAN